jgi:DivIVA domain-containing protein
MPLTPADVHNVAFSKPPIGKRGYNEDEVDAFLDLVEAELARLLEENEDLREQVSQLEQQLGNAQADLEDARSRPPAAAMAAPPPDPADPAPCGAPGDAAAALDGRPASAARRRW